MPWPDLEKEEAKILKEFMKHLCECWTGFLPLFLQNF